MADSPTFGNRDVREGWLSLTRRRRSITQPVGQNISIRTEVRNTPQTPPPVACLGGMEERGRRGGWGRREGEGGGGEAAGGLEDVWKGRLKGRTTEVEKSSQATSVLSSLWRLA